VKGEKAKAATWLEQPKKRELQARIGKFRGFIIFKNYIF